MTRTTFAALLTAALMALPLVASAQAAAGADPDRRAAMKAKRDAMTPEQKAAAREQGKAKWDSMTPEQQAAAKEKAKANWDKKTPEEQEAAKAELKAHVDSMTPEQKAAARQRHQGRQAASAPK